MKASTTLRLLSAGEQDVTWMRTAACRRSDVDAECFFPVVTGPRAADFEAKAKAICASCPVRDRCAEWALDVLEWGIAGGMSQDERRAVRRARAGRAGVAS